MFKYSTCKRFVAALFAAAGISSAAVADTVDLAGGAVTVEDITADVQYSNTSETTAMLTLDVADDVEFGGSIEGNILVVKKGAGTVTFAKENLHTAGTELQEGAIAISAENQLGTGTVKFMGGGLNITKSFKQTGVVFDFTDNAGTIDVAEGATFRLVNNYFKTEDGVFTKTGAGNIVATTTFKSFSDNAKWVIAEGALQVDNGHKWKEQEVAANFTVEIHENAEMSASVHMHIPNVVMRGGILRHTQSAITEDGSYATCPTNYSFKPNMTVLPSTDGTPSRVVADMYYSPHGVLIPVFNVAKDAELVIDCVLKGGFVANGDARLISGGFTKQGEGTLTLCHACDFDGGAVRVEDGVLRLKKGASISAGTDLTVAEKAKIELEDGAVLDCTAKGVANASVAGNTVLSGAAVWLDATSYNGVDGADVSSVANKGKAKGSFDAITDCEYNPNPPKWYASVINNRPAFYFDGNAMLRSDCYTNTTQKITMYAVVIRKSSKYFSGYISGKNAASDGTDNINGNFHNEDQDNKYEFFRKNEPIELSNVAGNGVPFCHFYESEQSYRGAWQYSAEGTTVWDENSVANNHKKLNINVVGVGGRMGKYRTPQYYGENHKDNNTFNGYIGELLIWSKLLNDTDKAKVTAYIKKKWFGEVAKTSGSEGEITVDVVDGSGGVVSLGSSEFAKKGEGELLLGDATTAKDVQVAEGTLTLASTTLVHKAAIWVDAADSSTLTVEDGKVVGARNKGTSGGVFTRNLNGGDASPDAPALATDINGLPTLSFDGSAALVLENSYVNRKDDRRIRIYMVGRRSDLSDIFAAATGRYSGPFTMTSIDMAGGDEKHPGAMHIEEKGVDGATNVYFYAGKDYVTLSAPFYEKSTPFILAAQIGVSSYSYGLEMQGGASGFVKSGEGTIVPGSPAMNIDIVQLGGRISDYGKAQWRNRNNGANRMWLGSIGEFIVCDAQLTEAEHLAMMEYLRNKWFKGNASIAKPRALETVLAPQLSEETNLKLAEGTTFESHVATLPLASLTVEGSATLARGGVTDSANYAMFNVTGGMSLPSAMSFVPLSLPDSNCAKFLLGAAAQDAGTTTWTVGDGSSTRWSASASADGAKISRAGMSIVIR